MPKQTIEAYSSENGWSTTLARPKADDPDQATEGYWLLLVHRFREEEPKVCKETSQSRAHQEVNQYPKHLLTEWRDSFPLAHRSERRSEKSWGSYLCFLDLCFLKNKCIDFSDTSMVWWICH